MFWLILIIGLIIIGVLSSDKFKKNVGIIFDISPLIFKWVAISFCTIGTLIFIFNGLLYVFNRMKYDFQSFHITPFTNISFAILCGIFLGIPIAIGILKK